MAEIDYVMWNCSGVLPTASTNEKLIFLEVTTQNKFEVLILIETHHKEVSDISPQLLRYKNTHHMIQTGANDEDPYAGIIMFIHKKFNIIEMTELIRGRLLNTKIKHTITEKEYNITPFYGYSAKDATKARIKLVIDKLEGKHHNSEQNLILGDFNFVHNDLDRTNENKTGMNQTDKTLSPLWIEFINKLGISDSFRENNKKRRMYSYIHTQRRAKSRIDRIYVNDENTSNIINYKHTPTPFTQTHRIVTFTMRSDNERGPGYWKMNTSIIKDPPFQRTIEKAFDDVQNLNIDDPIEKWHIFIETIRLETLVYISRKRFFEKKSHCEQVSL